MMAAPDYSSKRTAG